MSSSGAFPPPLVNKTPIRRPTITIPMTMYRIFMLKPSPAESALLLASSTGHSYLPSSHATPKSALTKESSSSREVVSPSVSASWDSNASILSSKSSI